MIVNKIQFKNNPTAIKTNNIKQHPAVRIDNFATDSFVKNNTAIQSHTKINFNGLKSSIISHFLENLAYKRSIKGSKYPYTQLHQRLKNITKEIQIPVTKDEAIYAFDINPNNSNRYIIFLHGFSHNITSNQPLYESLSKSKFGLLAIDYRGYGKNNPSKNISETNINEDIISSIKYLKEKKVENIGIIGHSFGAYLAAQISNSQKIAFQILVAPMTSLEFWLRNVLKHPKKYETEIMLIKYIPGFRNQYSQIFNIKNYLIKNSTPTYIVQAKYDRYIKCAKVSALCKHIQNLKSYTIIPTGGHRMDETKIDMITEIIKNL